MTDKLVVVPGRSIGPITLGMTRAALPADAALSGEIGAVGPVQFSLADGVVDDIWVDDLESRSEALEIDGQVISRGAALAEWERLVGVCEPAEEVIGGSFYNCRRGLTLGATIEGSISQIRIKPR